MLVKIPKFICTCAVAGVNRLIGYTMILPSESY